MDKKNKNHYYFGQLSWRPRPDIKPNTAEFTLKNAFRRDIFSGSGTDGLPVKGDLIFDTVGRTSLAFGDGTSTGVLRYIVIDYSVEGNWILGLALEARTNKKTIFHTYATVLNPKTKEPWHAGIKSSGRVAVPGHVNNPGGPYQLETLVEFETGNSSPVLSAPVVVNAAENTVFSFPVVAVDPDGDMLTCRMATDIEAAGIAGRFLQPGPPKVPGSLTVDGKTCVVTWDTTGARPGQLWSYQVVVEDGKSKACVDALIRIIKNAGEQPVCAVPVGIQSAIINIPFIADSVVSDPDGRIAGVRVVNLPLWASVSITPELPAADAIISISGTPEQEDAGLYVMSIVATDDDGNQAVSPLIIRVGVDSYVPKIMERLY